nr:immunoglobulin light chain junction region [Macaca mulatta]
DYYCGTWGNSLSVYIF